jgi:two-component system chemotaxis response regulator CheY
MTIGNSNAMSYLMTTVLGKDFTVTSVNNYTDALSHLRVDLNKEVIILDIPDTNCDNFELLEHMNSSSVFNNIRTVVISNSDDETLRNRTVELGASLFLTKPFDPVYLSDKVKAMTKTETSITRKKRNFNLNIF